jgi:hypothetical protein
MQTRRDTTPHRLQNVIELEKTPASSVISRAARLRPTAGIVTARGPAMVAAALSKGSKTCVKP